MCQSSLLALPITLFLAWATIILIRGFVMFYVLESLSYTYLVNTYHMTHQYEIEIKSLLGDSENASNLRSRILSRDGKLFDQGKQLNHYFIVSNVSKLHARSSL